MHALGSVDWFLGVYMSNSINIAGSCVGIGNFPFHCRRNLETSYGCRVSSLLGSWWPISDSSDLWQSRLQFNDFRFGWPRKRRFFESVSLLLIWHFILDGLWYTYTCSIASGMWGLHDMIPCMLNLSTRISIFHMANPQIILNLPFCFLYSDFWGKGIFLFIHLPLALLSCQYCHPAMQ